MNLKYETYNNKIYSFKFKTRYNDWYFQNVNLPNHGRQRSDDKSTTTDDTRQLKKWKAQKKTCQNSYRLTEID